MAQMNRLRSAKHLIEILDASPGTPRRTLPDRVRDKVKKAAAQWHWGPTQQQRAVAAAWLRKAATAHGWRLIDFLHECGIDGPAAWIFEDNQ